MINKEIIEKYNIKEVEGGYQVAKIDAVKAYLNDDYDWFVDEFLSKNFDKANPYTRKTTAKRMIKQMLIDEYIINAYNDDIYKLKYACPDAGYCFSRTCDKVNYTGPSFMLTKNDVDQFTVDCNLSDKSKLTKEALKHSPQAEGLVVVMTGEFKVKILFWKLVERIEEKTHWCPTTPQMEKNFDFTDYPKLTIDFTKNYKAYLNQLRKKS